MKDRIKQYMDYKDISAGELSSMLDVQRSNVSHILNGRNKPGASFIEKLLVVFPDLNARWLFTGEGEMVERAQTNDTSTKISSPQEKKDSSEKVVAPQEKKAPPKEQEVKTLDSKLTSPMEVVFEEEVVDKIILLYKDGTFKDFKKR